MPLRPAPLPALLFAGALVFGAFLFLRPGTLWVLGSVALILLGWIACPRMRLVTLGAGIVLGSITGFFHQTKPLPSRLFDGQEYHWTGIVEQVRYGRNSQSCLVNLGSGVKIRALLREAAPEVVAGDSIGFTGIAENVDRFVKLELPGLSSATNAEESAAAVSVPPRSFRIIGHTDSWTDRIKRLSDGFSEFVYTSGLDPEASALLCSAWLGRDDIPPDYRASFRALGLSHLLCVSGMHVGLVALVIALMLRPLAYFRRYGRLRYFAIVALVWIYSAITGLQPSAFRAAAMISVFYIMEYTQVHRNTLNTLFLAAAVVLLVNPRWIFAIGFQLSVLAVLGIVVLVPALNPFLNSRHRKAAKITNAVMLPVAVTIATFPVVLYWFHSISLVSVPANIVAALIFPIFMFGGVLAVIFLHGGLPVAIGATPVDRFAEMLKDVCDAGNSIVSGMYLSDTRLAVMLVLLTSAVICIRYGSGLYRIWATPVCAILMMVVAILPYHSRREIVIYSDGHHATALISGQAQAIYVSTSKNGVPPMSSHRYFGLQGYDPEAMIRLQSGYRTADIILADSILILPTETINLAQIRRRRTLFVLEY